MLDTGNIGGAEPPDWSARGCMRTATPTLRAGQPDGRLSQGVFTSTRLGGTRDRPGGPGTDTARASDAGSPPRTDAPHTGRSVAGAGAGLEQAGALGRGGS